MKLTRKDVIAAVKGKDLDNVIDQCEADRRDIARRPFSMKDNKEFWYNSAIFWHCFTLRALARKDLIKAWQYASRRSAAIKSFNESTIA